MDRRPLYTLLQHLRRATAAPVPGELTDAELLGRFVRRRDPAAFEVLVWRHGPLVWSVCQRVLRHAADVEDAFQATFLTLVRKAGSIGRGAALPGWLHQVAYRTALRARAEAAKRASKEQPALNVTARAADPVPDRDLAAVLDDEVQRLPEKYRLPIVLCHLQGLTQAEAARQLGCPEGTVAVRLARARRRLKQRLTRRGVALGAGLGAWAAEGTLSAALVATTVRAAVGYAAGKTAAGAVSASVLALTEGVLNAMFLTKLKLAAAGVLALVLV